MINAPGIMALSDLLAYKWQLDVFSSPSPVVVRNCGRQVGKTTVAAASALEHASPRCIRQGDDAHSKPGQCVLPCCLQDGEEV